MNSSQRNLDIPKTGAGPPTSNRNQSAALASGQKSTSGMPKALVIRDQKGTVISNAQKKQTARPNLIPKAPAAASKDLNSDLDDLNITKNDTNYDNLD